MYGAADINANDGYRRAAWRDLGRPTTQQHAVEISTTVGAHFLSETDQEQAMNFQTPDFIPVEPKAFLEKPLQRALRALTRHWHVSADLAVNESATPDKAKTILRCPTLKSA